MADFLARRWRQQPQGPVEIDYANALARSIHFARVPGVALLSAVGSPRVAATLGGIGFVSSSASDYWSGVVNHSISIYDTWTIFTRTTGAGDGTAVGGRPPYCERPNATQILKVNVGNGSSSRADLVVRNKASAIIVISDGASQDVRSAGVVSNLAGVRYAANDHRLFVDAREAATSSTSIATDFDATAPLLGRDTQDGSAVWTGPVHCALTWRRALSAAEIRAVTENPWQIFRPRRAITYSLPAGGGVSSGDASSAGAATAAATGAAIAAATASSAGVGAASATSIAILSTVGASAGAATVSGVGGQRVAAVADTSGVGIATGVGASIAAAVFSAAGVATVAGSNALVSSGVASAAGVATTSFGAAATAQAVAAAAGVALATGIIVSTSAAAASSAGAATASAVGTSAEAAEAFGDPRVGAQLVASSSRIGLGVLRPGKGHIG